MKVKTTTNKLWKKNFEIRRVDMNIMAESQHGFYYLQGNTIGKKILKEMLWLVKNLDNIAAYFPKDQLRLIIEKTLRVIISKPQKIDRIHKQTINLNSKYFTLSEKIRKLPLANLSNKELLHWYRKLYKLQYLSHGCSLPTTWFVDSDGEDLTNFLLDSLRKQSVYGKGELMSDFTLLTTPNKQSLQQIEELASLKILEFVHKRPTLKQWFMSRTTKELVDDLVKLKVSTRRRLQNHYLKWCWFPYTYLGPAYSLDYYLEIWRRLLHEGVDPKKETRAIKAKIRLAKKTKAQIIKKYKLSTKDVHLFNIAADIVWVKGFRKDCYFHGFYVLDMLLAELAKRSGLSLLQAKYLLHQEVLRIFKAKHFADLANERMKFCVLYYKNGQQKVLIGKSARQFLKKQKIERETVVTIGNLTGTCACPGLVKGVVKVINLPEDMSKMNYGDIMISHTTFPSLVPAMKKASAIVTEDGGVTCHAAIVARELQTPCVVGCKGILKMIKDGDKVQVNATSGTIKKI